VLAESDDDPDRYAEAKSRKNCAGTSPITRQSGKKKTVLARYVHNDRLLDALPSLQRAPRLTRCPPTTTLSASAAPATTPPSASWPTGWSASCTAAQIPARTRYDETKAWPHHTNEDHQAAA
jgi:hypothetical protein